MILLITVLTTLLAGSGTYYFKFHKKKPDIKELGFGGKNEVDKVPVIEPKLYWEITYKTQIEIVQIDNQVIISDYSLTFKSDTKEHLDPVMLTIDQAYKDGYIRTRKEKDENVTIVPTKDIKRIIYKPRFTMEQKREQHAY